MSSRLTMLASLLLLVACSGGPEGDPVLEQPPFAALTDSIRSDPKNAGLHYRRGALLYGSEQKDLAEKDLRAAWQLAPTEEHALALTRVLREKSPDAAIAFLEEAAIRLPESIALQVGLARGQQQKGNHVLALKITEAIIARYPNQLDALILRSELLKELNKPGEALSALEQAYAYAPFDPELAHQLAFEYAEAQNPRALALADSLIRADVRNEHAEPYYFKGVYYANTGNRAEALRQFDAAIRQDYNFLDAYMEKGRLQFEAKLYREAMSTFQLAITVSPTFADAYYWLGKTQEAQGKKNEAKLNYQRAYGLDKTLTEAKEAAERI